MSRHYGPKIVTDGLVLYLDAGNVKSYPRTGTVWTDLSGNSNHGELTNGPTFSSTNGGSMVFDGSDDYVDCGVGIGSLDQISNIFTITSFIKTPSPTSRLTIFSMNYNSGVEFGTSANTPGGLEVYSPGVYFSYTIENLLQPNIWYQVTYTRSGIGSGTHKFYINASLCTLSLDTANNFSTSSSIKYIGTRSPNNVMFIGNIALTQIYNRALTQAEILQNYNATKGRFGL